MTRALPTQNLGPLQVAPQDRVLRAADVMTTPVFVIGLQDTMWGAWSIMLGAGLRHLVVCDGRRCVGVLDDRTLFANWPTGPYQARTTQVRQLLRPRTTCVLPEASLARVATLMVDERTDAVPVTAADGAVLGIVTSSDLAAAVARFGVTQARLQPAESSTEPSTESSRNQTPKNETQRNQTPRNQTPRSES